MKTTLIAFTASLAVGFGAFAQEAVQTEPTVEVSQGARMKLVPAKPSLLDSEDPLGDITNLMTDVVGDLAAQKTDRPVQGKQKEVVDNLDVLIKELEKQCKGGGNGGSRNPTKPMNDSRIAGGPGGMGDLINPKTGTRNFGALPPKQRDAIRQSQTEGFPPGYESLLQSYYQRLAQEKVADASTGGGGDNGNKGPATRPSP